MFCCFVVMTIMTLFYVPCDDDFLFAFRLTDWTPIRSLSDVIISNIDNYYNLNGRVLVHILLQTFIGFDWIVPYAICCGIFFALLQHGIVSLVCLFANVQSSGALNAFTTLCLMILIPEWGHIYGGNITFTINYLWTCAIYVLFAYFFYSVHNSCYYTLWQKITIYIFAIIAGMWHDSFAIGVAASLGIYCMFYWKKISKQEWILICCFFLGFAFLFTAPGSWHRFADMSQFQTKKDLFQLHLTDKLFDWAQWNISLPGILVFNLSLFLCLCTRNGRKLLISLFGVWFTAITMTFFALFVAYSGHRQLVTIAIAGIIMALVMVFRWGDVFIQKWDCPIQTICGICLLTIIIPTTYYRAQLVNVCKALENSMYASVDGISYSTELEYFDRVTMRNNPWRQWVNLDNAAMSIYTFQEFSPIHSRYLSRYDSCSCYIALPSPPDIIRSYVNTTNKIGENMYLNEEMHYIIGVVPEEIPPSNFTFTLYTEAISLIGKLKDKFFRKPIKVQVIDFGDNISSIEGTARSFCLDGQRYILFSEPTTRKLIRGELIYTK